MGSQEAREPEPVYVTPPPVTDEPAPVAVAFGGYNDAGAREWRERREWREHEWRERGRWGRY
jgi:hypothetical protein